MILDWVRMPLWKSDLFVATKMVGWIELRRSDLLIQQQIAPPELQNECVLVTSWPRFEIISKERRKQKVLLY